MKNIKIILLLLLALTNLLGVSNFFENKLKVFDHQDISFFIGNLPILDDNEPDFSTINANAWKSLEEYPRNNIEDEVKVWFRIDLSGIIIPFNAVYFHSLKNNLKVYYPFQIYPTKVAQKSFNAYNNTNSINKQIISLDNEKYTSSDFQFNKIYFSIDIDQKTPLFKFFPVVVGDEENIKEYVINEEILKRNTDYITFFIGNFLFFVSLITFIIFLLRLKSLNWTVLYFSLLMATAGIFYLILSPLSLFFSDFTFTRMLYLLTFYNLIWFFFGLVVASFLKKKWMSFISVLVIINLIMSYIFPDSIHINRLAMLILLAVYNILIIFQLRKSKLDFLNTESLFSVSSKFLIFCI